VSCLPFFVTSGLGSTSNAPSSKRLEPSHSLPLVRFPVRAVGVVRGTARHLLYVERGWTHQQSVAYYCKATSLPFNRDREPIRAADRRSLRATGRGRFAAGLLLGLCTSPPPCSPHSRCCAEPAPRSHDQGRAPIDAFLIRYIRSPRGRAVRVRVRRLPSRERTSIAPTPGRWQRCFEIASCRPRLVDARGGRRATDIAAMGPSYSSCATDTDTGSDHYSHARGEGT